jgi:alpha-tubulin suppressor-like RCC1 family protein
MFIWGDNEEGYSDHQLSKIVKPFEVTNAFQLTKDETITSYQLIDGTNSSIYQWLFIINQKHLYALKKGQRVSLLPLFENHAFSAILKLKSKKDTHVMLTDKNELFLWGRDWSQFPEGVSFNEPIHFISKPIVLNALVENEKIIDFAMNDHMLVFLTNTNQIYLYGQPYLYPGSIKRWQLFTFNPNWAPKEFPKKPILNHLTKVIPLAPNEKIIQVACNDDCIGVVTSNQRVFMWGSHFNGLYEVFVPIINFDLFTKK